MHARSYALQDEDVAARVQHLLSTPRFRCYRTTDVTGVELGGALKNVLAIACGELSGSLGWGSVHEAAATHKEHSFCVTVCVDGRLSERFWLLLAATPACLQVSVTAWTWGATPGLPSSREV
jgi:hypothetical protein